MDRFQSKIDIGVPLEDIDALCRKHHVRELALFGSAARGDARLDSDLDFICYNGSQR
ncbi:MAG: nucleotidyltransferase family protein [Capsulimonadaceae bacterium]